jgi:hypothetical protein
VDSVTSVVSSERVLPLRAQRTQRRTGGNTGKLPRPIVEQFRWMDGRGLLW